MMLIRSFMLGGLLLLSGFSCADLIEADDQLLSDVQAQQGLEISISGVKYNPLGSRLEPDPDNPPALKSVFYANRSTYRFDTLDDGLDFFDFSISTERLTTDPLGDGLGLTFRVDMVSRTIADATSKNYIAISFGDAVSESTEINLGPGDFDGSATNPSEKYYDPDSGAFCSDASADCVLRGVGNYQLTFNFCDAPGGTCFSGTYVDSNNIWGRPTITGRLLIQGHEGYETWTDGSNNTFDEYGRPLD